MISFYANQRTFHAREYLFSYSITNHQTRKKDRRTEKERKNKIEWTQERKIERNQKRMNERTKRRNPCSNLWTPLCNQRSDLISCRDIQVNCRSHLLNGSIMIFIPIHKAMVKLPSVHLTQSRSGQKRGRDSQSWILKIRVRVHFAISINKSSGRSLIQ